RGDPGPGRTHPRRDRLAVPRAATRPWEAERTGERRPHLCRPRAGPRRGTGKARSPDRAQRRCMLRPVKKSLGQHFLRDPNILEVIGRLAELGSDDVVLEIGPGEGVLTRFLAARVRRVCAVEIDRALEPALSGLGENVDVVFGDAPRIDLPQDAT